MADSEGVMDRQERDEFRREVERSIAISERFYPGTDWEKDRRKVLRLLDMIDGER